MLWVDSGRSLAERTSEYLWRTLPLSMGPELRNFFKQRW